MAKAKRAFTDDDIPTNAVDYHGFATYAKSDIEANGLNAAHISFTFEEAMKLSLAIQACLVSLNKYKRSTIKGREMGMEIQLLTNSKAVSIIEKQIKPIAE